MSAQTITRDQIDLMSEWQSRYSREASEFGADGIVDPKLWVEAPIRVLFLLKEPNKFRGEFREKYEGDLRNLFAARPWPRLGYWAYGIQRTTATAIPSFSGAREKRVYGDALRASAVVNIKKTSGVESADVVAVGGAFERDRDLLARQMVLGDPDVVVCGGTFDFVEDFVRDGGDGERVGPDGRCWRRNGALWIEFYHPSARYGNLMMYYGLMMLYQNAIKELRTA